MTAAHQHAISAKANFLREQEVKRSGRSQNPSTDARRQGMTAAAAAKIPSMRGGKV